MIKTKFEITGNSVKCPSCEKDGHKLESVLVETKNGYRDLKFCICCGSKSVCRSLNSNSVIENECSLSSNSCLVTTAL